MKPCLRAKMSKKKKKKNQAETIRDDNLCNVKSSSFDDIFTAWRKNFADWHIFFHFFVVFFLFCVLPELIFAIG